MASKVRWKEFISEIWAYGRTHFHYVAAISQVNLTVKNILTQATRHGLTARLGCDVNLGERRMKACKPLHGLIRKRTEL